MQLAQSTFVVAEIGIAFGQREVLSTVVKKWLNPRDAVLEGWGLPSPIGCD
jgi:hypothetical protein